MGRFWVDVGSMLVPIWNQKRTQNQSRALGAKQKCVFRRGETRIMYEYVRFVEAKRTF